MIDAAKEKFGVGGGIKLESKRGVVQCILRDQGLEYRRRVEFRYRLEAQPKQAVTRKVCNTKHVIKLGRSHECLTKSLSCSASTLDPEIKKKKGSAYSQTSNRNDVGILLSRNLAATHVSKVDQLVQITGSHTGFWDVTCMSHAARFTQHRGYDEIGATSIEEDCIRAARSQAAVF
jgi:hypothetical protein